MAEFKIVAEPRVDFGKATHAVHALQATSPLSFTATVEPKHLTLPGHETTLAVRNADAVLVIEVEGETIKARVQDIQRHPIRPELQHIDLVFVA